MKSINKNRIFFYCIGMIVLAFGITLNSKVDLGLSPITTISFAISNLYPISFADMTMFLYFVFVGIELVIHFIKKKRKSYYILDIVQIPFAIVFTRFMGLFSGYIPVFSKDLAGTIYAGLPFRFLMLAVAIICTGIGAIMMLDMALIPNPADGMVQALASVLKRDVSTTKIGVDFASLIITCIVCFTHGAGIIGINIGSVIAMLCVGRVMGIFNKFALNYLTEKTQ